MDLSQHFRAIWRARWIVLGAALVAALAVFAWQYRQPTEFRAETRLEIVAAANAGGARPIGDDATFIAESLAARARSQPVLAVAAAASDVDVDDAGRRTSVRTEPDTGAIIVGATGPSALEAAALSDAVADAMVADVEAEQRRAIEISLQPLSQEIGSLAATLSALGPDDAARAPVQGRYDRLVAEALEQELRPIDRLAVVAPPDPVSDPVGPHPVRHATLALLVALVVVAEAAVIAAALRGRFPGRDLRAEVAAATGIPVVAVVPRASPTKRRAAIAELRANLALMTPAFDAPSSIAVVGTTPGVGCTQIAIDLAVAASRGSRPVLLVDADMHRPAVHERMHLAAQPGLSEALGGEELAPCAVRTVSSGSTVHVLVAGARLDDAAMTLSEHFAERVLRPAATRAGLTIVDTPPITTHADAVVLAAQCDTTLLVVHATATSRRVLDDVIARLRQVGVIPFGIVLNGVARSTDEGRHRGRRARRDDEQRTGTAMPSAPRPSPWVTAAAEESDVRPVDPVAGR